MICGMLIELFLIKDHYLIWQYDEGPQKGLILPPHWGKLDGVVFFWSVTALIGIVKPKKTVIPAKEAVGKLS